MADDIKALTTKIVAAYLGGQHVGDISLKGGSQGAHGMAVLFSGMKAACWRRR